MGLRPVESHAVAMRYLVKAVFGGDRTDLDRLEQHIVTRFSGHIEVFPANFAVAFAVLLKTEMDPGRLNPTILFFDMWYDLITEFSSNVRTLGYFKLKHMRQAYDKGKIYR